MNVRKVIQKTIRRGGPGADVVGHVNAAVAANVNEPGRTHTRVSSKQRIVQRGRRTDVFESEQRTSGEPESADASRSDPLKTTGVGETDGERRTT